MATPFSQIYTLFLSQITDYSLATMSETTLEENLQLWLLGSLSYFSNCAQDLSDIDLDTKSFNVSLNHSEKQILSKFMLCLYVDTQLIKEDLMKQNLTSKDYRMYSPANQIKALIELKAHLNAEANVLISRYSYNIHRLKGLFE